MVSGATPTGIWPSLNVTLNDISVQDPKARETRQSSDHWQRAGRHFAAKRAVGPSASRRTRHYQACSSCEAAARARCAYRQLPQTGDHAQRGRGERFQHRSCEGRRWRVVFINLRDRVENRIDGIDADAVIGGDREVRFTGSARRAKTAEVRHQGGVARGIDGAAKYSGGADAGFRRPVGASLSAKAQVRANGAVLQINGLSGTLDGVQFNGWASADLASKPLVKLDLDFQRLDLGTSSRGQPGQTSQPAKPWSDEPINLAGLNYVDAQIRMSAAELNIGDARFRRRRSMPRSAAAY